VRANKNIVGSRIKQARQTRNPKITQLELLELLKVYGLKINQSTLSKIEAEERPVFDYELKAIGEALAVTIAWLIDEQEI